MTGTGDVGDDLYKTLVDEDNAILILGRKFLDKTFWHSSNVTSIMSGVISESGAKRTLQRKTSELLRRLDY